MDRVHYTGHARHRMAERGATADDMVCALLGATDAIRQPERDNWRIEGGVDLDGDELTVIAGLEADLIIITCF